MIDTESNVIDGNTDVLKEILMEFKKLNKFNDQHGHEWGDIYDPETGRYNVGCRHCGKRSWEVEDD